MATSGARGTRSSALPSRQLAAAVPTAALNLLSLSVARISVSYVILLSVSSFVGEFFFLPLSLSHFLFSINLLFFFDGARDLIN